MRLVPKNRMFLVWDAGVAVAGSVLLPEPVNLSSRFSFFSLFPHPAKVADRSNRVIIFFRNITVINGSKVRIWPDI